MRLLLDAHALVWWVTASPRLRALDDLPMHHRDPFDRLLIAQAIAEGIPIATNDPAFAAYGVQIVW